MRLLALAFVVGAATFTMGCAGSRAYNLYSGGSPLDASVYGVDQSITMASGSASDAVELEQTPAVIASAPAPAPQAVTRTYSRRTTLQSPPPPPPPPVSRPYRTTSRVTSTPVRAASTVRAPTRTLPPAQPVVVRQPVVSQPVVSAPAPRVSVPATPPAPRAATTYCAPTRPAPARTAKRPFIAPIRKNNCSPGRMPCFGGR